MTFTKSPVISTYQTKPIRLVKELNSRGTNTSKDEDYVNVFAELIKNRVTKEHEFNLVKREGSTLFADAAGGSNEVRGSWYWKDQSEIYLAISTKVYVFNAVTGALVTTLNAVFGTSTGAVGFCEFLYDSGAAKLVVTDGTTLSTIDTAHAVVAGADADMPVHIPMPVFLDGYLFILKSGTADIYNSNLNDPLAYTAGDFITAEMFADKAVAITKLNNYLVVFGNRSIEYFWDAAEATGSPLQRNDTPVKLNGFLGGLAQLGNRIYFIGAADDAQPDMFILEDFKIVPNGSEALRRHLGSLTGTYSTSLVGNMVSISGHDFYVLNTGTSTYALELESKLWARWAYQAQTYFPIAFAMNVQTTAAYKCVFVLNGSSNNAIYKFSPTLYQDNGTNFTCTVVTDQEEFETFKQKSMSSLIIWADKTTATASVNVSWTDDDYQTFNTPIAVDLFQEKPDINRLGRFRRRAFKLTFAANYPLRLKGLEADLNMGQS